MDIIFATNNQNKVKELRALFAEGPFCVYAPEEQGFSFSVEEDGETFEANAIKKAVACMEAAQAFLNGKPQKPLPLTMADDSGLEIDALQKRPGVYSARYLGEDTPYSQKNRLIIDSLKEVPPVRRTARFVSVVACVWPDGQIWTERGVIEGEIAFEPAGEQGFGYDPIFYLPDYGMTMAQLDLAEKNRISHRGKAVASMRSRLMEAL